MRIQNFAPHSHLLEYLTTYQQRRQAELKAQQKQLDDAKKHISSNQETQHEATGFTPQSRLTFAKMRRSQGSALH